jgi:PAS domain S-box-containing protein
MVILAVALALQVNALKSAQQSVDHSDRVVSADRELIKRNVDMETGVRGFLYTGQAEFLEPYTAATNSIEAAFTSLQRLIADDPTQQARLATIHQIFVHWRLLAADAVARRADPSVHDSDAIRYRDALTRKKLMDRIRAQHEIFTSSEMVLRNQRIEEVGSKSRALSITCYLVAFGGVCFASFFRLQMIVLSKKFEESMNVQRAADASAHAVVQQDLEQAGLLQRAIFNSANFSSIATDAEGVIQIFNVGAERMLGYEATDVINKLTPANISDPQELIARSVSLSDELETPISPGFDALVFKASRGIEDIYELTYVRKDGSRFPAVVSVTALRDAHNAIIGYLLIGTDNTARRQAETDLRRSDDQLRTLLHGVKDYSILMLDTTGCVVTWNEVAQSIKGYRADEIIGCHFSKFYTPDAIAQGVPDSALKIAAEQGRF